MNIRTDTNTYTHNINKDLVNEYSKSEVAHSALNLGTFSRYALYKWSYNKTEPGLNRLGKLPTTYLIFYTLYYNHDVDKD